jgi:hypothetical protein
MPTKSDIDDTKPGSPGSDSSLPVCFVIMPISDAEPYPAGHFRRVYEHIIKPACSQAGMRPLRADDVNQTNHIVLDVLRHILSAEMAVCDLSARNPNVFYELGIRQAFNKPVSLIKDLRTPRVFDIQGLRDIEYDEGLRVDTIDPTVQLLAESLMNTLASHQSGEGQVNSLVQLLGLSAAALPQPKELSPEGSLVLTALAEISGRLTALEYASRSRNLGLGGGLLELVGESATSRQEWPQETVDTYLRSISAKYQSGTRVRHRKFGAGTVVSTLGSGRDEKVRIDFDDERIGRKTLIVAQANLEVLEDGP